MSLSMYAITVPPITAALHALSGVLAKGQAHADARKVDPAVLLATRVFPDMFPLSRQVQIATDIVKGGCARLAGVEPPSYPDTEASFAELQARIEKTIAFIGTMSPAQLDGSESRTITMKIGGRELKFLGQPYLSQFVLPNLYFHSATAYGLLRHAGVEVGKMDFLGALPLVA